MIWIFEWIGMVAISSYNDGCNQCSCDGACTKMYCIEPSDAFCTECATGYVFNTDTKQCELSDSPSLVLILWFTRMTMIDLHDSVRWLIWYHSVTGNTPSCGGFDHCTNYFDGCNNCWCSESGVEACHQKGCTEYTESYCTDCDIGYQINKETKQCEECSLPRCQNPCGPFNTMKELSQVVCNGHPIRMATARRGHILSTIWLDSSSIDLRFFDGERNKKRGDYQITCLQSQYVWRKNPWHRCSMQWTSDSLSSVRGVNQSIICSERGDEQCRWNHWQNEYLYWRRGHIQEYGSCSSAKGNQQIWLFAVGGIQEEPPIRTQCRN